MDKSKRQQQLLEIVTKIEVNTQEELIKILEAQGLKVTQATISRDIKELGLIKTSGKSKKYRYARVFDKHGDTNKLLELFKVAVVTITCAQNLIVVKTLTLPCGRSNSASRMIQSANVAILRPVMQLVNRKGRDPRWSRASRSMTSRLAPT